MDNRKNNFKASDLKASKNGIERRVHIQGMKLNGRGYRPNPYLKYDSAKIHWRVLSNAIIVEVLKAMFAFSIPHLCNIERRATFTKAPVSISTLSVVTCCMTMVIQMRRFCISLGANSWLWKKMIEKEDSAMRTELILSIRRSLCNITFCTNWHNTSSWVRERLISSRMEISTRRCFKCCNRS